MNTILAILQAGRARVLRLLALFALLLVGPPAVAETAFSPMLTLRHGDRVIELEREQLEALPQHRLQTSTTLSEEKTVWEGPLARDVLALLDLPEEPAPIRMTSWDDYRVDLTSADFHRWDVILALRANGQPMSVLELGPLRVIYPRDQHGELRDQRFDHRWVWMLNEIIVEP